MLAQNLVISNFSDVDKTFNLNFQQGNETRRQTVDSSPTEPVQMIIRHSAGGKSPDVVDRHNVIFSITKIDEDTGKVLTVQTSVTITVPRNTVVTDLMILDTVTFARNFLESDATVLALRRNES